MNAARHMLEWYLEAGVDDLVAEEPFDRFRAQAAVPRAPAGPAGDAAAASPPRFAADSAVSPAAIRSVPVGRPAEGAGLAEAIAAGCGTLAELRDAVAAFDACALKGTATHTVFSDGVEGAPLMVIGEAPGAEEDRAGKPFVGQSGRLLDLALAAAGFSRETNAYITNVLFWRPPGNRKPNEQEVLMLMPFVKRHIALGRPKAILAAGGTPASALLDSRDGITRLRGKWREIEIEGLKIPVLPAFHPAFLLRQPLAKREFWADLLSMKERLDDSGSQ